MPAQDHHQESHGVQKSAPKPAEHGYPEHPERHPAHANHTEHAVHDKHAGHSVAMFRDKFWISLALTLPTLVWGHMLQRAFRYTAPEFPGSQWIPPIFGTAVFLYGGWVFLQGAVRELRDRLPGMMTLISCATQRICGRRNEGQQRRKNQSSRALVKILVKAPETVQRLQR